MEHQADRKRPFIKDVALLQSVCDTSGNTDKNGKRISSHILRIIELLPGNDRCCDFGLVADDRMTWVSFAHGTFLCDKYASKYLSHDQKTRYRV